MVANARFWDRLAEKYFATPIKDEESYQIKLKMTQEHLRSDMRVLEIGCGTGGTALKHAEHVEHIHAVDLSEGMLSIARREAEKAGVTNVSFERSDIDTFQAPSGSYDAVLTMSLLHLLEDRKGALKKIRLLLSSNGVFVSSTPALADKMGFIRFILPVMRLFGKAPYVDVFKAAQLEDEIEAAGFRIVHRWQPKSSHATFIVAQPLGDAF